MGANWQYEVNSVFLAKEDFFSEEDVENMHAIPPPESMFHFNIDDSMPETTNGPDNRLFMMLLVVHSQNFSRFLLLCACSDSLLLELNIECVRGFFPSRIFNEQFLIASNTKRFNSSPSLTKK